MNGRHKEGELFKRVDVYGSTFNIYYGYYNDFDRKSLFNEPVPVYPDLNENPKYDPHGYRIVTKMQISCEHYRGNPKEDSCAHCPYFKAGKDLFGICLCELNRKVE